MRTGNLIFSAVQFLIVAALISVGAVFFGLHYLPQIKGELADWILREETSFIFVGSILTGLGLFLGLCFFAMQKHQFIRLQNYFVDEEFIKGAVATFWEKELSELPKPIDIYLDKEKIEVVAPMPEKERDLKLIEKRLGKFLARQVGYKREFFISLKSG